MDSRPEICRIGAGNHGGLQRIKEVIHTVMSAGIGRPEAGEIGIHALIYLARFLPISSLIKSLLPLLDSFFFLV